MVAIAKYKSGYYKVDSFKNLEMIHVNGKWYYNELSRQYDLEAIPPLANETVTFLRGLDEIRS